MSITASFEVSRASYDPTYVPAVYEDRVVQATVGTTLFYGHKTYQVMSDVWEDGYQGCYWDRQEKRLRYQEWARGGEVDATAEVLAEVRAWKLAQEVEKAVNTRNEEYAKVAVGDVVKVVRGRSDKGQSGKVIKTIYRPYRMGWQSNIEAKYGIALDDEQVPVFVNGKTYMNYKNVVWVWARNCDKVTPSKTVDAEELADITKACEGNVNYWIKSSFPKVKV